VGNCDVCGKKIPFLGGCTDKGKHYCKECFYKKNKSQEEKPQKVIKEDKDKNPKKVKMFWGYSAGLILMVLLVLWAFGIFGGNEEYTSCINDCVSDNEGCMIDYSLIIDNYYDCVNNFNSCTKTKTYDSCLETYNNCVDFYITDLDNEATACSDELKYCVSGCELDHGK